MNRRKFIASTGAAAVALTERLRARRRSLGPARPDETRMPERSHE